MREMRERGGDGVNSREKERDKLIKIKKENVLHIAQ